MERLSQVVLVLAGLMYLIFGVIFLIGPVGAGKVAGFEPIGHSGRTEIRAFYGGMELGIGGFLLAGVWLKSWRRSGLWLVVLLLSFTAIGRGIGFAFERQAAGIHILYVLIEAGFAMFGGLCLFLDRPRGTAGMGASA